MYRYLSLTLALAIAGCLDSQELDVLETATDTANTTVVSPALAINAAIGSGVRLVLWRSTIDTAAASFWPAGAKTVQVIITKGDSGDASTVGKPTAYIWIVKNGASVYKVWRVQTAQLAGVSGFNALLDRHFAAAESGPDSGASHVILGSAGTHGPRGPHIGPGGGGEFTLTMVKQTLATAAEIVKFADVTAKEYPVL